MPGVGPAPTPGHCDLDHNRVMGGAWPWLLESLGGGGCDGGRKVSLSGPLAELPSADLAHLTLSQGASLESQLWPSELWPAGCSALGSCHTKPHPPPLFLVAGVRARLLGPHWLPDRTQLPIQTLPDLLGPACPVLSSALVSHLLLEAFPDPPTPLPTALGCVFWFLAALLPHLLP